MAKYTLREKFRYHFENTMSGGPIAVIRWLAIVSIVSVVVLGAIIVILGITGSTEPDAEPLGFVEGTWKSLMATLDPGTMGGDEGWDFRIVRFIATLIGIFVISILIGSIASGIDQKIEELKRGRSRVLNGNHTLILGWSPKIFTIITELIEANSNQKKPCIVILSEMDKVEAEEEIKSRIPDFGNTKIVVRSGSTLESSAAEMVNINEARSIIVLAPEVENPDTHVIKTVLGITNGRHRKSEPYHIVAEIKDERNMEAAELVGNGETVYVLSEDLIARIIAQTCRQSGLSVVYSDLLQFEGDEIYFESVPSSLVGKTYRDSLFAYEDSAIIGVFTDENDVLINPPMDRVYKAGDSVIAISEDDDTVVANGRTEVKLDTSLFNHSEENGLREENTLVLGWNDKGGRIIAELDNYVKEGSHVLVVASDPTVESEVSRVEADLVNQKIAFCEGDTAEKKTLLDINTQSFDHIIVLSNRDIDIQESDAKTLISLLHLRGISESLGVDYSIVTEMLDMRNRELGVVAKADDFVVSDNLISLMLNQLSENRELKKVYDILFQAEGSEIYLKPVSRYVKTGTEMDFYTVTAAAAELNESAIGYRITSQCHDAENLYGVNLNPNKSKRVSFNDDDMIIVLSED
ncbi:MAG TPA: NAD-binding protein [Pyrinomonadaceae bacterium]|mgnify:CR=1 FL=1|nr:NAD-binding protein [Pyrinomonadaceae bacterium]